MTEQSRVSMNSKFFSAHLDRSGNVSFFEPPVTRYMKGKGAFMNINRKFEDQSKNIDSSEETDSFI